MTFIDELNNNDHFARNAGAQLVEVREGYARAEMTVTDSHANAAGVCQGGAIYTLADLTFAAVANCRGIVTLGIANNITFLKSAQIGDVLTSECRELLDHHKLPYCDMKVTNQNGELVAVMTGLAYRLKKEFPFDSLM